MARAHALTEPGGASVLLAAREAFLHGVHVTAAIAAIAALTISVVAMVRLRHIPPGTLEQD
ncbi:hypothetical protein [Nocardia sp. NBC_00403]|uniref:hypothetical protein n=1 Tax=Nocardia sp. NBC_00403 TaxID=2975990 RepID=UPI002E1F3114